MGIYSSLRTATLATLLSFVPSSGTASPPLWDDSGEWEDLDPQPEEKPYSVFTTKKDTPPYWSAYKGEHERQVYVADWNGVNRGIKMIQIKTRKHIRKGRKRKLVVLTVATFIPKKDCSKNPPKNAQVKCYAFGNHSYSINFSVGEEAHMLLPGPYYVKIHDKGGHHKEFRL